MCLQTLLAAYITIVLGSCTAVTDDKCQPAEEGQPYQMRYTLTTIPEYRKVLLWFKDDHLMSECLVAAGDCSNNDISWFQAKVVKNDEGFQFILNIGNVTRDDSKNVKGIWTLKTHNLEPTAEDMYICVLQVYAKAKDLSCVSDLVTERATISCTTSRIYPEAMIDIYRDDHQLQTALCKSYKISENPLYYKAACKIIIATEYLYIKQNNFNISIYPNIMGFSDHIRFGTVKTLTLQNGTNSQNHPALIVVTTLLIVAILLIVALCVIYVKKCNSVRDVLLNIRNRFYTKKADDDEDSCSSPLDIPTLYIEARNETDVPTCLLAEETVSDKNMFKTTSILLLGTQRSNKQLIKRSIINGDYTIEITQKYKTVVDLKSRKVLLKYEKLMFGNFPNISLPDEGKISLHYTKREDQVIKIVDGPVFDEYNVYKFIDDIKKCIVLSQEGYNAIILAFTADRVRECKVLLEILYLDISVDMKYVFPIFIYENKYKLRGEMIHEYSSLEKVCGERLIQYNIENHTNEINMFLSRISQMENNCTIHLLCEHKDNFQRYSELEEILKELNLLFEVCLDEPIKMQDEMKVHLDHVEILWCEYQGKNDKKHPINGSFNIEENQGETEGLLAKNIQSGTKQKLEMDSNITEDITHIMECLRYIYFGEEPMKRCKVILMESLEKSYNHFHDWYVSSVTKDRDNLLNRHLIMRL